MIIPYKGKYPKIDKSVFICEGAKIIGDVVLEKDVSVWFNVVIRGDVNYVKVGKRTNVQDGSVLHVTHNKYPLIIGSDVTIGHNATVHACIIKDFVLIGMGSIVLDNALVNSNVIIAAGSLVRENFIVPERVLVAGVPAKIVRELKEEEIGNIQQSALNYVGYSQSYKEMMSNNK